MPGEMPAGIRLDRVEIRLEDLPHRHDEIHGEAIAAHWREAVARRPLLYDGEVVLGSSWSIAGGALDVRMRKVRYSTLLHWLATPGAAAGDMAGNGAIHVYAAAAMIGADGRAILGRMAAHTANGGRIYLPSGSLEPSDFSRGVADLPANMAREVMEETGIDLSRGRAAPHFLAYRHAATMALVRPVIFRDSSKELLGEIKSFLAGEEQPELQEVLSLAPGEAVDAMPQAIRAFMQDLAREDFLAS
jgi:8-oxo-dGTP pyrophosphatase MutT (NUDIX family)